jgi:hypothetical protein
MSIMSSVYDLSMGMPTSELIYMIFYRCLVVHRFLIRCAPGSQHTHMQLTKSIGCHWLQHSYFGGHSVTHDFGHHDDVWMMVYSGSSSELSPEKSYFLLFPEISFLKEVCRLLVYLPTRMHDSRRLP